MTVETVTPTQIETAFRQGQLAGIQDSKPGMLFRSAFPAAADHGYNSDGILRSIFTLAYLDELPKGGIVINHQGLVVA